MRKYVLIFSVLIATACLCACSSDDDSIPQINLTDGEIFEEFINSKEFNLDEIKEIKSKKDEDYIQNYIYVARHFFDYRNL